MSISRVPPEKQKNNSYVGYTTTTLSRRLTYHLCENSVIKKKHLIIKHNNSTNQLTSSVERKISHCNFCTGFAGDVYVAVAIHARLC